MSDLREEQLVREAALRQAALGRRVAQVEEGRLGPVLKRWINADVVPIADAARRVAQLYLAGDMEGVALALATPTSALSQRERPLRPLMEWVLQGASPGRSGNSTTYAEDLALAFMGSLIPRLAAGGAKGTTLSAGLGLAADVLRDTVQGQFITSVQGAEAMQRIREKNPEKWQQKRSLQRIAMQMRAQVKPQFLAEERGETEIPLRGNRKVLHVTDYKGDLRRLEFLRSPTTTDWEIMSLCWHDTDRDGATHPHRSLWLSLASMFLSLAQQTGGWFEVVDLFRPSGGRKHKTKMLVLSEAAIANISRDVERWVGSGFVAEPMLVPPEDGDFLTVKHRKVTGQRPPKGLITDPSNSFAWDSAVQIAQSPWRINELSPALDLDASEDAFLALKLEAHRRLGGRDFYLPVNMDFRGRVYYRTPWVTPQSNDLGKSLLCFPPGEAPLTRESLDALIRHWDNADPLTEAAHRALYDQGEWERIPVQLDGTCNGLQHLSALMRDEVGAKEVNLTIGGDRPKDIYGVVAGKANDYLSAFTVGLPPMYLPETPEAWMVRLFQDAPHGGAGLKIDRSICKGPVMVLPYGGTREAVRLAVKEAVLAQLSVAPGEQASSPWHLVEEEGYSAFRDRDLADHPLFNTDVRQLSSLIYSSISPAIPRAMALMDTLQKIGTWTGTRALAWQTGPTEKPLWVVQAKSKASRKQVTLKGYHLPDVIRRLTLVTQTNEVDPRAHRNGIVANFVHSLDAEHLARTIRLFKDGGGTCVGTIHDCVMVRPSEVPLMHRSLRRAFMEMYESDPLSRPVKVIETEGVDEGKIIEYGSWYELAAAAGVSFPEKGEWQPSQVLDSQWFFS